MKLILKDVKVFWMKIDMYEFYLKRLLIGGIYHPIGCMPRLSIHVSNWWGTSWRTSLALFSFQPHSTTSLRIWALESRFDFENRPNRELLIPKSLGPEESPRNFLKGTNWTISRVALWPFIGLFKSFPSPSSSSIASKSALPTPWNKKRSYGVC